MSLSCFVMNLNRMANPHQGVENSDNMKPLPKEKLISYEEKSVGSTAFFKCEACPYMAFAEDDMKFHLFTVHPELAKSNGLADNVRITCPGCSNDFDAEETLRTHLRNHHKMGIKDVKKMIKSLVQIALKDAKLKKHEPPSNQLAAVPVIQDMTDVKIPQVIEIVPDIVNVDSETLPKGVTFISVDELHKMSTPNFEKVDPKEIIQEASINIVYTNEMASQYVKVSNAAATSSPCSVIQMPSVPPDLISSITTRHTSLDSSYSTQSTKESVEQVNPGSSHSPTHRDTTNENQKESEKSPILCSVIGCNIQLKEKIMAYHRKCHQNGKLQCPECTKVFLAIESLHSHLWKAHAVDMELPTCKICGFKTVKRSRLYNIHMRCHATTKPYMCSICSKSFKNVNQLSKHKVIHNKESIKHACTICDRNFSCDRKLKLHIAAIHEKLKPFKCGHCEHTAARKDELKLHMRSHTGVKPYSCDQCAYRTADHNAIRRHKKIHSNEGVYKCDLCPYTTIQSTVFATHMMSRHPTVTSAVHRCPYCPYKSVSKDKYVTHLTTKHIDKEGIQLLIEMTKGVKVNKPSWNIPSETDESTTKPNVDVKPGGDESVETSSTIPIEVYDCDSLSESLLQEYSNVSNEAQPVYNNQEHVTDLSKDDNNSDCVISESSNDTMIDRSQYTPQHPLQMTYDNTQSNLHGYLHSTSVSMGQSLLQNSNVNSVSPSLPIIGSNNILSMGNNIMSNFPIRLPPTPHISVRNNFTLKPVDKISLPMTKVMGPIIKPTQILPVPSSSNSPVNTPYEPEGVPRKKPKISVKSNLILKGPDQVNMFHSQQKMAFKRLEDNERFGLGGPVTFNNLITTQFMQLQPEPVPSESPSDIITYPQETMLDESASTPVDNSLNDNSQMFTFNQQMNVNSITMIPPPQKIQTNDPSFIKLEATIKQNTQSPSLERMCNANLLDTQAISREYKASPPLEDIHKNISEIKNEVKSDYYNMTMNNARTNPPILDQYLIDNIIGEQYAGHIDLSNIVMSELSDQQQNDVIEIDDNSEDNKLLPRYDFPLESLYLMHNDFHFLENDIPSNNVANDNVNESRINEVPLIPQKENIDLIQNECLANDFPHFISGKKDPMMNTSVKPTNKINVKNIELMKN